MRRQGRRRRFRTVWQRFCRSQKSRKPSWRKWVKNTLIQKFLLIFDFIHHFIIKYSIYIWTKSSLIHIILHDPVPQQVALSAFLFFFPFFDIFEVVFCPTGSYINLLLFDYNCRSKIFIWSLKCLIVSSYSYSLYCFMFSSSELLLFWIYRIIGLSKIKYSDKIYPLF